MTSLKAAQPQSSGKHLHQYLRLVFLACVTLLASAIATAQDYVEWSTETRTSLGFRVNSAAIE